MNYPEKVEFVFMDWPKAIAIFLFGGMVSVIFLGIFIQLGVTSQFITDNVCAEQMNESFINGTQGGYLNGINDTSNLVLEWGVLPVVMDDGNFQYLNLSMVFNGNDK